MHIGCHLSTSDGYAAMGRAALSIGADTFQFFSRNPRGGSVKIPTPQDVDALVSIMRENSFAPAIAHAPYTLNPCAAEARIRDFTRQAMGDDLKRLSKIPNILYNFHPGSHVGQGVERGIELIAEMLNSILTEDVPDGFVLLEAMSGKGSEVGGRFEELAEIIEKTKLDRKLGVCLDTCHVYSAGYDVVSDPERVLAEFDRVIGLDRLKAIHLNDSMTPFASRKDRHQTIGNGSIGFEPLLRFVRLEPIRNLPFVLETPNELPGYADEIARFRSAP